MHARPTTSGNMATPALNGPPSCSSSRRCRTLQPERDHEQFALIKPGGTIGIQSPLRRVIVDGKDNIDLRVHRQHVDDRLTSLVSQPAPIHAQQDPPIGKHLTQPFGEAATARGGIRQRGRQIQDSNFVSHVPLRITADPVCKLYPRAIVVDGDHRERTGIADRLGDDGHAGAPGAFHQEAGGRGRGWGHDQDIGPVEQRKACLGSAETRHLLHRLGQRGRCHRAAVSTPEQTLFFQLGEVAPRGDRRTIAMGANVLNRYDLLLLQQA